MELKLLTMKLINFKGLRNFEFCPDGQNCNIYGDNGTGKTTVGDAYSFLLFGKSMRDEALVDKVKTYNQSGDTMHKEEHSVEGAFMLLPEGRKMTFKRQVKEKWVTPRGSDTDVLKGHETLYWINEVPMSATDYNSKVSSFISDAINKLLTNPLYFSDILEWKKRREALLSFFGDVDADEIISANPSLADLPAILENRTVEDMQKVLKERIKKAQDEKAKIKPSIQELQNTLPQTAVDYTQIDADIAIHTKSIADIDDELFNASKTSEAYRGIESDLVNKREELYAAKRVIDDDAFAERRKLNAELENLTSERGRLSVEVNGLQSLLEQEQHRAKVLDQEKKQLLQQFYAKRDEVFQPDSLDCPTCGQTFPASKLAGYAANFNKLKAESLAIINERGKAIQTEIENVISSKTKSYTEDIAKKQQRLSKINKRIDQLKEALAVEVEAPNYMEHEQYKQLHDAIQQLTDQLATPVEEITTALRERKNAIQSEVDQLKNQLAVREIAENTKKRIAELKANDAKLAKQISEYQKQTFLCDEFIKLKMEMLDIKINSRFSHIRFRLFKTNVTANALGEYNVEPCCDTLVNTNGVWVPWSEGNNAGRINAGLEIINILSKQYDVSVPIIVDNAEGVSECVETHGQLIRLIKPTMWDDLDDDIKDALIDRHGSTEAAMEAYNHKYRQLTVKVI